MCSSCCTDFAAILFNFFSERRSREIDEGEANDNAAANDETARGASSSTHTSTEGQEKDTSSGYDYEVFLSFRGSDTRATFTDHLYTRLEDAGIRTFKDDESLHVGEEFAPELLQAIKQSKILIPIFSKGYASSVWCLKEVVQMVECKNNGGQKIIPIFYDVAPTEVRRQTGDYENAFLLHDSNPQYDQKTIGEWKAALRAVGEISGHDLQSMPNRGEGKFVKTFAQMVFSELKKASLAVSDYLVSVDKDVDAIMEMIGAGTSETRIIGIYGMSGIGKTTIAKIIFDKFSNEFENCCFLRDIQETSKKYDIQCLQKQLISGILKTECMDIKDIEEGTQMIKRRLFKKSVLLLLDDVEEKNHIEALALVGKRDWLGKGSKIIITTRRVDVLLFAEVDWSYELMGMDGDQSLQLFSKCAFKRDAPLNEYINQSKRAIDIAGGLPLALEVIGSLLFCTKRGMWDDQLEKLESVPNNEILSKLKISYDVLDSRQQRIFLDVACFFSGYDKDILVHFWDESKYSPEVDMNFLQNMCLIKINEDNTVWMHNQLRDLGRKMVYEESKTKIVKQSRIWDPEKGLALLRHKGNKEVQALRLKLDPQQQYRFTYEGFESLSDLRFLEVGGSMNNFRAEARLLWHESPSNVPPANENSYLLPQLRWLSWHHIPPTFNITNFSMEDVVFLDLSWSDITHDWKGWSHMEAMKNLKILNLTRCNCLERTPIFSAEVNLERLILKRCESLTEIDRSICHLKSLVSLDVSSCKNLRRLPDELGRDLANLQYLSLEYCKSFERLPNTIGNLESLIKLNICGTGIKELPDSIGKLKNLKVAKLSENVISKIPDALWTIEKLEEIDARFYFSDVEVEIGNCIYRNQSLRILRLRRARIYVVPRLPESLIILELFTLDMDTFPDLSNLTNLKELKLGLISWESDDSDGPVEEHMMPRWIGNLSKLETLDLDADYVTHLPTDINSLLPQLQRLHLTCHNLRCLPSPSSSLLTLYLDSECLTTLPADIRSLLPRLRRLHLTCPNLRCLPSLPSSLLTLYLDSECLTTLPADIRSLLPRLQELNLQCPNLCCLPSPPSSLLTLDLASACVTTLPADIRSLLPRLQRLHLTCPNLRCLPSPPSSLLTLDLDSACVTTLPADIRSLLPRLQELRLKCPNLRCLPSLPSRLWSLILGNCESFGSLGDLSYLNNLSSLWINDCVISKIRGLDGSENLDLQLSELRSLHVHRCVNLVEIQGELPQSLEYLWIHGCGSLQKLPDLSSLKGLREVRITSCGKLNVEAISLLCSEKGVTFEGDETN